MRCGAAPPRFRRVGGHSAPCCIPWILLCRTPQKYRSGAAPRLLCIVWLGTKGARETTGTWDFITYIDFISSLGDIGRNSNAAQIRFKALNGATIVMIGTYLPPGPLNVRLGPFLEYKNIISLKFSK